MPPFLPFLITVLMTVPMTVLLTVPMTVLLTVPMTVLMKSPRGQSHPRRGSESTRATPNVHREWRFGSSQSLR